MWIQVGVRALVIAAVPLTAAPVALAWPGRPSTPPPKPPGAGAPPPAWIETQTRSSWLAYGSYCWKTSCIDMLPPDSRPGLPAFSIVRGGTVRVHLGFSAKTISVTVDKRPVSARLDGTRRVVTWKAARGGILTVSARAAGDASYVTRLRMH